MPQTASMLKWGGVLVTLPDALTNHEVANSANITT